MKSGSSFQNNRLFYSKRIIYRNSCINMSIVSPQGGPWSLLTPGAVSGLAHSQFFSFSLLVKKLFNLSSVISPDIWGKRGLFPSEFGLRRGYIEKAELSLCSHWVTSIDISKSRLSIIRSSGVSVHWDTPRRSLPWWTDHHPSFRLCLLGLHICAFHCLSTKKSTQADGVCRDKLQA